MYSLVCGSSVFVFVLLCIILKRERKLVAFQSYSLTILEIRKVTDGHIYTEPKL